MKPIDFNSQRTRMLMRLSLYVVSLTIIGFIALALVYAALGYDIDRDTGEVIKNGLILVESQPESAEVTIMNIDEKDTTPSKFTLPEGSYDISINDERYYAWQKNISLTGSSVLWLNYPQLIPRTLNEKAVASVPALKDTLLSADNKLIFAKFENTSFGAYDLENIDKEPIEFSIDQETIGIKTSDDLGVVRLLESSANGKWLLHTHTLKNEIEYIVRAWRSDEFINISQQTKLDIASIDAIDDDFKRFFLMTNKNELYLFDRESGELTAQEAGVEVLDFASFADKYAVVVKNKSSSYELRFGSKPNSESQRIITLGVDKESLDVQIINYENSLYLVLRDGNKVKIYKDPKINDGEVASKAFKSVLLDFDDSEFSESTRGRFVGFNSGNKYVTYDLEEDSINRFTLKNTGKPYIWVSDFHLFSAGANLGVFVEFDGENSVDLVSSKKPLESEYYFTDKLRELVRLRRLSDGETDTTAIFTTSLIAKPSAL